MGSFERNQVCDTYLVLGLGSCANSIENLSKKNAKEVDNHVVLDLNLSLGEQSGKKCSSEECEISNENNNCLRKKLRLSKIQSSVLEESFKQHSTLNTEQKNSLASELNLMPRQVEVWFQNRRARTKLKLTETDCERWKKSYEEVAEENRKLKQEMESLQALKRIKLDRSSSNFPKTQTNSDGDFVCPNCRRNWSMTGNIASSGNGCPIILKPKPKYVGVKLPSYS